jgi:hypothetical protein
MTDSIIGVFARRWIPDHAESISFVVTRLPSQLVRVLDLTGI